MYLGLDIGTTTVSAVVVDANNKVADSVTIAHNGFLPTEYAWERKQDPEKLLAAADSAVKTLKEKYAVTGMGITGQQHGIVYLDKNGQPVSPLYIWQDARGNELRENGETYVQYLSKFSCSPLAAGYGLATHYYNMEHGLVPENAVKFCTIHDLAAMRYAGLTAPVTEPSDAQSLGFYDLEKGDFDKETLQKLGMDVSMLPEVRTKANLGNNVAVAIGDNQASFLGTTEGRTDCALVNIGTGSQISIWSETRKDVPGLEVRPFPYGGYLLVGASLCGGRAYAILENFFRTFVGSDSCYGRMAEILEEAGEVENAPKVKTTFAGTRLDPNITGSILGITEDNFTPAHMISGFLHGIAGELAELYHACGESRPLVGSGNGLRKNVYLCRAVEQEFNSTLTLSSCQEEAAVGAALFARTILNGGN